MIKKSDSKIIGKGNIMTLNTDSSMVPMNSSLHDDNIGDQHILSPDHYNFN
jgi:hypothetical protein